MFALLIILVIMLVVLSDLEYSKKILICSSLFYYLITNYRMDKMSVVKYYNSEIDNKVKEKTKFIPVVKEDPRKRNKKQNMTVMDNHSFAVEQETDAREQLVEVLKNVENIEPSLAQTRRLVDSSQTGRLVKLSLAQTGKPNVEKNKDSHLEDLLNKSLNLYKVDNTKDGDFRLNERSKVQGSRDLQSNRIRQQFTNKNIYTKYFNKELDREENKIWWEQRDPIL